MARHKRSAGRHRALKPPSNRTPSLLSAAVVGATDPTTGQVRVVVSLPNTGNNLVGGLFAEYVGLRRGKVGIVGALVAAMIAAPA